MDVLPDKFTDPQPLHPGKSAEVFKAKNRLTGREVFLKKYPIPELDAHSALREPQLLRELEHDNLVKIYSADVLDSNEVRLEMELVNGGSFQDLLNKAGSDGDWPSVHESMRLIADVASGLSHLSSRGFVHRDVKPANLVIRENAGNRQGVVADLGLATRVGDTGRAFATKHARIYRPPEVWQGRGYSLVSDVYQLGIVLYQLLGGYLNHDLANLGDPELATLAAQSKIISLDSLTADVGPELRKVVKRSTALEESRYKSLSEFIVDLGRAKAKEIDWTYRPMQNGFILTRVDASSRYKVEAVNNPDALNCTIKRFKAKDAGVYRQKKPALVFAIKGLETNKLFRRCLIW